MRCVVVASDRELGEKRTYENCWHSCEKRCNVDECDVIGNGRGR